MLALTALSRHTPAAGSGADSFPDLLRRLRCRSRCLILLSIFTIRCSSAGARLFHAYVREHMNVCMHASMTTLQLAHHGAVCNGSGMIIAVVNQKGGVGKTTLAVHLAMWYAEQGASVVVVDTDEQRTASRWIDGSGFDIESLSESEGDGLIEASPELAARFDIVVADGPANLAEATRALLLVSNIAVVPCGPTIPELEATHTTIRMVRNAQAVRKGEGPAPLLVLSRMRPLRFRLTREAIEASETFGIPVASGVVPAREAIADAAGQRTAVWRMGGRAGDAGARFISLIKEVDHYANSTTQRTGDTHGRGSSVHSTSAADDARRIAST